MTDEQKCLEWLKHRRDNTPMAGAKRMFGIAISALEKQEADKCCETCKHKDRLASEWRCSKCFRASNFEDYWEPYTEEEL